VALKTLGVCALLTQCGVLPPVAPGSTLPVFHQILVDIGDSQDVSTSLSTFSGHMTQLIRMIRSAEPGDLVLIDEIGTGTDPAEGAALGVAILEALYAKGCLTMATTHYGELKAFGEMHTGFENGAMAFDEDTLQPLYRLDIGASGSSKGFWISERLGLQKSILDRAKAWRDGYRVPVNQAEYRKRKERATTIKDRPETIFTKGDRVRMTATDQIGLFYDGPDETGLARVLVDDQLESVHHRRLELILPASELYPAGYDLDQLFSSFASRKLEKDLVKGRFKDLDEVNERLQKTRQE
jgi:DNA mismatch repair ATPase MutS